METNDLRSVTLVAQQGSFAAAARVLGVDPSSVSRLVAGVEHTLGIRLFHRTTRSLTLTEAGDRYLRRVAPVLEELDSAREEAQAGRRLPSGRLKITASVAFTHECLVPYLPEFYDLYPDLGVDLLSNDSNVDIQAEGIDLAIRLAAAPSGDLISTRMMRTRYHICAAPEYIAAAGRLAHPSELTQRDCVRFALPGFRDTWHFRSASEARFDVAVSGRTTVFNALTLRSTARNGMGPALLADWLIRDDLRAGRLVDLFPDYECTATDFDTGAWALYPSRSYLPGKVRVALDFFRKKWARQPD